MDSKHMHTFTLQHERNGCRRTFAVTWARSEDGRILRVGAAICRVNVGPKTHGGTGKVPKKQTLLQTATERFLMCPFFLTIETLTYGYDLNNDAVCRALLTKWFRDYRRYNTRGTARAKAATIATATAPAPASAAGAGEAGAGGTATARVKKSRAERKSARAAHFAALEDLCKQLATGTKMSVTDMDPAAWNAAVWY
jgi:hypothetical protein